MIEADEYDTAFFDKRSKFVHYRPRTAILNNLEYDHADIFEDLAAIERQFHHLVRTVPAQGRLVVNAREESLQRVLAMGCWSDVQRFRREEGRAGALRARGEPHAFDVLRGSLKIARVEWSLLGEHNQLNALAAIGAAEHAGVAPDAAARGPRQLRQRAAPPRAARQGQRHRGLRRLRPPPDRDPHDDQRPAPQGRHGAHPRGVRAALEHDEARRHEGAAAWSLEEADLAFCHSGGLGWDAVSALKPMGAQAVVCDTIDKLVARVVAAARPATTCCA